MRFGCHLTQLHMKCTADLFSSPTAGDAGPSGADIDGAHYKKVVKAAGCAQAISELRTTCARAPRKTVLFRREGDKEVRNA